MKALPSPRQLQYLVALSETGHFGRAADRCLVTQSTLSAGIKELETLLGTTVVERTKRRVVMTALGRTLAARAREALRYLEDMTELAASHTGQLAGPLNLGVIPTIAPYLMPQAMVAVRKAFPALRLFLREEQTDVLLARLDSGELDAAVIALPYEIDGFTQLPLGEEDLVVCLPKGHSLADHRLLTPALIAKMPMLTLESGHCWREHSWSACRLRGKRANEVFQATSLPTLVQMVAAGLGLTLLPRMAVAIEATPEKDVVVRPVSPDVPARTVALIWRKTSTRDGEMRALGGVLQKACKTVIAAGHKGTKP